MPGRTASDAKMFHLVLLQYLRYNLWKNVHSADLQHCQARVFLLCMMYSDSSHLRNNSYPGGLCCSIKPWSQLPHTVLSQKNLYRPRRWPSWKRNVINHSVSLECDNIHAHFLYRHATGDRLRWIPKQCTREWNKWEAGVSYGFSSFSPTTRILQTAKGVMMFTNAHFVSHRGLPNFRLQTASIAMWAVVVTNALQMTRVWHKDTLQQHHPYCISVSALSLT